MRFNLKWPWKMVGRYADGEEVEVSGNDEEECMGKLIDIEDKHGEMTWYSGVTDEDYQFGEYVGRNNFIYN